MMATTNATTGREVRMSDDAKVQKMAMFQLRLRIRELEAERDRWKERAEVLQGKIDGYYTEALDELRGKNARLRSSQREAIELAAETVWDADRAIPYKDRDMFVRGFLQLMDAYPSGLAQDTPPPDYREAARRAAERIAYRYIDPGDLTPDETWDGHIDGSVQIILSELAQGEGEKGKPCDVCGMYNCAFHVDPPTPDSEGEKCEGYGLDCPDCQVLKCPVNSPDSDENKPTPEELAKEAKEMRKEFGERIKDMKPKSAEQEILGLKTKVEKLEGDVKKLFNEKMDKPS